MFWPPLEIQPATENGCVSLREISFADLVKSDVQCAILRQLLLFTGICGRDYLEARCLVPWSANANCYNFNASSIKQHAPTGAGVYGLYNFRHQVVIASATNLRAELLKRLEQSKFRFPRLTPSGFIFETCSPEGRELRAQELVWEYAPLLHDREVAGLRTWWRAWRDNDARAFQPRLQTKTDRTNPRSAPQPALGIGKTVAKTSVTPPKRRAPDQPAIERRGSFGLIGAAFGVIFLAVGLIGLLPHLVTMSASFVDNNVNAGARQRLAQTEPQPVPLGGASGDTAESQPGVDHAHKPQPQQAAAGAPAAPVAPVIAQVGSSTSETGWSVQALASTDRQIANVELGRLKAKGYEAFLVEATIKGQTWYRVRIGNFASRLEAESFRVGLRDKEAMRDAFVAANAPGAVTLAALNRR
jgi:cell division septation protein DedD